MLGLLKSKNPYGRAAKNIYADVLKHIRNPVFYTQYGVPDSFDGRFDLLLVHVFLVIDRLVIEGGDAASLFNQALFDVIFADMDQTLREMGIGDMGVPKHMRRMMKAFNGRMHAYEGASEAGVPEDSLPQALRKNLYGTLEEVPAKGLEKMAAYMQNSAAGLREQALALITGGQVVFIDPAMQMKG
ncbi:MAG: ubiquinol-cytochrome C chaperone family protein [Alphaproteobacteria bacterium]|nr:ubiquinol-cytochrome C chaperone family protein [Alphaproteobacteria bacterium]